MNLDRPVADIEGIGVARETQLNQARFVSIGDLVRVPADVIHRAVGGASRRQAEDWQCMAWLLQIDALTPQWAEALVKGGVQTLEELLGKSLAEQRSLFAAAQADGVIPDVPDDETLFEIAKDAALIHSGATAMLLLTTESGAPIEGAEVRLGPLSARTDANGRCRLIRITAAPRLTLRIVHPEFATHTETDFQPGQDNRGFRISYRSLRERSAEIDADEQLLDEFQGATLPALTAYRTRWQTITADEVPGGDVLRVHDLYADGQSVKAVTIFRAMQGGELVVRQVKLAVGIFDEALRPGMLFRYQDGQCKRVAGGIAAIERYRAQRKTRVTLMGDPDWASLSPPEKLARYLALYRQHRTLGANGGAD